MSDTSPSALDSLRQPEYTGENRCTPCTVLNLVIAAVLSGVVALFVPPAGVAVFACSVLVVYLRGYLVPGTPTLTKRYLPDRVLARFDAHPEPETEAPTFDTLEKLEYERNNAVDPEQFLLEEGAIRLRECGKAYRLTAEFAARVDDRMAVDRRAPVDRETLAELFDTEPGAVEVEDRPYPAIRVDRRIRKWPARAALVADLATHEVLRERTDRWSEVPLEQRLEILERLRSLHETCPMCGGEIEMDGSVVDSCCRSYEVVTLGCRDCGERLLEFDPEAVDAGEADTGIVP